MTSALLLAMALMAALPGIGLAETTFHFCQDGDRQVMRSEPCVRGEESRGTLVTNPRLPAAAYQVPQSIIYYAAPKARKYVAPSPPKPSAADSDHEGLVRKLKDDLADQEWWARIERLRNPPKPQTLKSSRPAGKN